MPILDGLQNKPRRYKVLAGLCAVMALVSLAFFSLYLFSGDDSSQDAMQRGQRLNITIATGNIEGKMHALSPATTSEATAQETASAHDTPEAHDTHPEHDISHAPTDPPAQDHHQEVAIPHDEAPHTHEEAPANIKEEMAAPQEVDPYAAFTGEETATPEQADPIEQASDDHSAAPAEEHFAADPYAGVDTIPVHPRSAVSLAPVSNKLQEKVPEGMVPRIGAGGTKAAEVYARPFMAEEGSATIALVISGLGSQKRITQMALDLPLEISLSFDPYAEHTPAWAESARNLGHEAWLDAPMQPADYPASDPGEYGLLADAPAEENLQRLKELLTRFGGYVGLVSPTQESFSVNRKAVTILVSVLKQRGLMLLFGNRDASVIGSPIISSNGATVIVPDVIIDSPLQSESIDRALATLERIATQKGYAVGLAHAYPVSLRQITAWEQTLKDKNIILAPLSAAPKLH